MKLYYERGNEHTAHKSSYVPKLNSWRSGWDAVLELYLYPINNIIGHDGKMRLVWHCGKCGYTQEIKEGKDFEIDID